MKYKQMWQTQKRITAVLLATSLVLLFLLALAMLSLAGNQQFNLASQRLYQEQLKAAAQTATGYNLMYQTKPPVYAFPETNEEIIQAVFGDKTPEALQIAKCESGLREDARNSQSTATGLFQIMASVHGVRRDWLEDPIINTLIAKKLYESSSWNPWVCQVN